MANDDTNNAGGTDGIPLIAPDTQVKEFSDDQGMGIVFKETRPQPEESKLDMNAPLTAPRMQGARPIKRRSLLTNTDDVFDVGGAFGGSGVESGTIVTDKRHKSVDFGEAVTEAFSEWYSNLRNSFRGMQLLQKKEVETITPSENRKEVIKQAVETRRQVPHDDHAVVIERFKTLSHDAERLTGKPYLIKKDSEKKNAIHDDFPTLVKKETPPSQPREYQTSTVHTPAPIVKERPTLDLRTASVAPTIEQRSTSPLPRTMPAAVPGTPPITKPTHHEVSRMVVPQHVKEKNVAPTVNADIRTTEHVLPTVPERIAPQKKSTPDSGWSFLVKEDASETELKPEQSTPTEAIAHEVEYRRVVESKPAEKPIERELPPTPRVREPLEVPPPHREKEVPLPLPVSPPPVPQATEAKEFSVPTIASVPLPQNAPVRSTQKKRALLYSIGIILIVLLGAGAGIGTAVYVMKRSDTSETLVTPAVASFFSVDALVKIPFSVSQPILLNALKSAIESAPRGVTHIYMSTEDEIASAKNLPTTEAVLTVIAPHTTSRFLRGLDEVHMIGSVTTSQNEPFIVIRSDAFDSTFAGMLEWEPYMQTDLAPLFGTPEAVSESNTVTRSPFVDALRENRSIRVLYDNAGNERMIYAFVNRTTVVITSSTEALSQIIGRIR